MHLTLKRSQHKEGMMGKKVIFVLDAHAVLTEEEAYNVREYGLGSDVIYNSDASKKHLDAGRSGGLVGSLTHLAMASMSLNITVTSLTQGQTIKCKTLDEVLGAEEALRSACQNLKGYLDAAATFDGTEETIEF
jgi:hypothetical protein